MGMAAQALKPGLCLPSVRTLPHSVVQKPAQLPDLFQRSLTGTYPGHVELAVLYRPMQRADDGVMDLRSKITQLIPHRVEDSTLSSEPKHNILYASCRDRLNPQYTAEIISLPSSKSFSISLASSRLQSQSVGIHRNSAL